MYIQTFSVAAGVLPIILASPLRVRSIESVTRGETAIKALQTFYSESNGLWDSRQWWQSANSLTALADLHSVDENMDSLYQNVYTTTFKQAQASTFNNFINDYYDDEGWWAMAWIRVYDVTKDTQYLAQAETIFADMQTGLMGSCGGQWWDKEHTQVGAIENELFISVAASLANRDSANSAKYLQLALSSWNWFKQSGLIQSNNVIMNDLNLKTCKPQNDIWTYNQGVILGGLSELYQATQDTSYIDMASSIAIAAIGNLTVDGIVHEHCDPSCENDTSEMFKGPFIRNLAKLYNTQPNPNPALKAFIGQNADSVWNNDRTGDGKNLFGPDWSSYDLNEQTGYDSHSAGTDAIIAAIQVGF